MPEPLENEVRPRAAAVLRGALAILALGVALGAAAPAHAADLLVETETLAIEPGDGGPESDPGASGGRALRIEGAGAGTGVFTTSEASTHLFVRLRGEECLGPPTVSVSIDGVERFAGPAASGGYAEPSARLSIPAGSHSVSVALTNPYRFVCGRSVWVDRLTIVGHPFSPSGWRNARLAKNAPLMPNSKALVNELRAQVKSQPRGAVVGFDRYSVPVYTVPPDQARVRVSAPRGRSDLQAQWASVPLPASARPAEGTDQILAVWQPSTDTLWEFWGLGPDGSGGWTARYGGRMQKVSAHEGHFTSRFGASASSIGLLAGLQRIEELRRGSIGHAVDFAVQGSRGRDGWCWPAQRTDPYHSNRSRSRIALGTRFRFPARFDLKAYARDPAHPLSRYALTVALAIQRHGMVVRESSGTAGFFAEDPGPTGANPYGEIFEGRSPDGLGALANFPWRMLQAVAPPPGRACVDDPDRDG